MDRDGPRARRVFGTGRTIGVWEAADGALTLGLPVESGLVGGHFAFPVGREVLDALTAMPRRADVLFLLLHDLLQSRLMRGAVPVDDAEIGALIARVAALDAEGLESCVEDAGLAGRLDG